MRKTITENGIEYRLRDDNYLPNLTLPEASDTIGVQGELRRKFLREHHEGIYTAMLLSGKLQAHLEEVNAQASPITNQLKSDEGVTGALKAKDQMEWTRRMNGIRQRTKEVVLNDLIQN